MPHDRPRTAERRWHRFLARLNANEHESLLVRRPDVREIGVAAQLDESMRWSACPPPLTDLSPMPAELDARRYRLAWLSASRRAQMFRRDAPTALPNWIALRGLNSYWTGHCLHDPCPAGFYAQGTRSHVEGQAHQHIIASHGSTT